MALLSKTCGLQNKALKVYCAISNGNKIRSFSKFGFKANADATTVGYSVGFALFLGVSNYYGWQKHRANIIPTMNSYNLSYCASSLSSDDNPPPQSPRNTFNFLADVVEKTKYSLVYIEIDARHPFSGAHIPISNGSGFIVKNDGLILTNAHVVNHFGQVTVKMYDGTSYLGYVESLDTESDLATVRIKAKGLPTLPLGRSSDIRPGEFVIAMGNPLTLSHTITAGVVSSANRKGKEIGMHEKCDYIQTDATIHIGNSGGPLVNLDGEAIGINTMKLTEGISFAIPIDCAIEFLKNTETTKAESRGFFRKFLGPGKQKFLGVTLITLSESVINELREHNADFPSVNHGLLVWRVMLQSPSYDAGIRPGDVITRVNEKEVYSTDQLMAFIKDVDTFQLTVHRGQSTFKCIVSMLEPIMP